jgi:type VI secretion system secreted protein VgrG
MNASGIYTQEHRILELTTPLGKDVLLLRGFSGTESISRLFQFNLDLLAENGHPVPFDKLLGQSFTIRLALPDGQSRYVHGICRSFAQAGRGVTFTSYHAEIVPQFWLLTKQIRSRVFQHVTVPDILKEVLAGMDTSFETQGAFRPRDYCVQYRETDFNFASRLMEEEGIYYFFKHTADGHKLVLGNTPASHADIPDPTRLIYEELAGGARGEERIHDWEKSQELRSGKVTLWDHCFELPHKHLEAEKVVRERLSAGKVSHKLKLANNDKLEIYDYPGGYAQRFDGIDPGGAEQSSELQHIFEDSERTVDIRLQQETVPGLSIQGASNCRHLAVGHKFSLTRHFDADGQYVLTSVSHVAKNEEFEADPGQEGGHYSNTFVCIPYASAFRPVRVTPKPVLHGCQTAVVVGPDGEEIFTDKYGRVKVQFFWDREGNRDANSSCWVRVGSFWAGKGWGAIHIPRVGQEVIVGFEEGDPDQPVIIGSVYNADQMPPYQLPDQKTKSGTRSRSSIGGGGLNEFRFEDKKGHEQVFLHGEKDLDIRIKNDRREWIGQDRHLIVIRDKVEKTERDSHANVGRDLIEQLGHDHHLTIAGKEAIQINGSQSTSVAGDVIEQFGSNQTTQVASTYYLQAAEVVIEATTALTIKAGASFINISPAGIEIVGAPMVMINSGGAPGVGVPALPVSPIKPIAAAVAATTDDTGS